MPATARHSLTAFLLALAATCVIAPEASATTLTGREVDGGGSHGSSVVFVLDVIAAPGEHNDITMAAVGDNGGKWRITDATAPLIVDPSSTCTTVDPHTATCGGWYADHPEVSLGDGDDTFRVTGSWSAFITVSAGAGDDTVDLRGPNTHDTYRSGHLDGGPGDDSLSGTDGWDTLVLSSGRDHLDAVDWGSEDTLVGHRGQSWVVDLAAGTAVHGEDHAQISGFTRVEISKGTIRGDERENQLFGVGLLDGRGGNDSLEGSGTLIGGGGDDEMRVLGRSSVDAGPGEDTIDVVRDAFVTTRCGTGRDATFFPDGTQGTALRLDAQCETVAPESHAFSASARPTEGRHRISLTIACTQSVTCFGSVSVAGISGATRFAIGKGAHRTIRLRKRGGHPRHRNGRILVHLTQRGSARYAWWLIPRR